MIRVLIVDDHAVVRHGLRRILDEAGGIEVGAEATNGIEALKKIRAEKWDIVLLDVSMPEKNGIDTLKQIMYENKAAKVLILSMYPEDQYAVRLMKIGASGYMTKDTAPEQLVEAIRNVVAGKKYISPNLAELLLHDCGADSGKPVHELLSNREYQVLRLLGSGEKVSEIAATLSLSIKTVSTHRTHILEKMKLKNNAELIFYVIENGLKE
ncbi:MAG: DNA-binding response regulator [Gallionellales bacterium RIFCSPHIGHO2_02_FULL_57_16]|nr:MAG: DNA-binding response regulator [Gallionellales bacterium RIFCSPHIGHO2_02_FULL_57_16]